MQDRYSKSYRLAGSGVGNADYITAFKAERNSLILNGRRAHKAFMDDVCSKQRVHGKIVKLISRLVGDLSYRCSRFHEPRGMNVVLFRSTFLISASAATKALTAAIAAHARTARRIHSIRHVNP